MRLFSVGQKKLDTKYTSKVGIPQYLPSSKKPMLEELCNYSKYSQLIKAINESSISDEEKKFLRFAATRHIIFNYGKIADYYAHSNEEMQKLMEQSALVIIDVDDAIVNGYVKLSKDVYNILEGGALSEE